MSKQNIGIFIIGMPGARILRIVAKMLIDPMMDEIPIKWIEKIMKSVLGGPYFEDKGA